MMMPCGVLVCCLNTKSNHRGSVISNCCFGTTKENGVEEFLSSKNDKSEYECYELEMMNVEIEAVIQAKSSHQGCIMRLFIHYKLLKIRGIA
ncbi:hypothetical protein VNO78_16406 [Psophocarpus tetragonolobus]|uniref:Uncharacterized protein n=1 Tax=Psophocarpus tetragonolobus TaxID=3891 RepID=A0AAN9XKG8_PSOTE